MKNLLLLLFLFSCSFGGGNKNTDLPEWYLNPPKNSLAYLYGVGYGTSLDQATQIALSNIAEKISITVSSSFVTAKQESIVNDKALYEAEHEQDVTSKVQGINFTNYEVDKSIQQGMYIYSLVKVSKSELVDNYFKKVNKIDAEIRQIVKDLNKVSDIEQFARLHRVKEKIAANEINLKIIETLEKSNLSVEQYYVRYEKLLQEEIAIKNKIVIKIISKPSDSKLAAVISKSLNDLNIKTSSKLDPKNKAHALLRISGVTKNQVIYGTFLAKISINLKLLENYGNQISSGALEVSGSSTIDSVSAVDAAIASFKEEIRKKGLFKIIGL